MVTSGRPARRARSGEKGGGSANGQILDENVSRSQSKPTEQQQRCSDRPIDIPSIKDLSVLSNLSVPSASIPITRDDSGTEAERHGQVRDEGGGDDDEGDVVEEAELTLDASGHEEDNHC